MDPPAIKFGERSFTITKKGKKEGLVNKRPPKPWR